MLQPHEQRNFDEMAVHDYTFSPEAAQPSFTFNVDGVDVILVSLTCKLPDRPPRPPLLSPPPPAPSPPSGLQLSFGLRSLSSRLAVGVILLLLVARVAAGFCRSERGGRRSVISAADGSEGAMAAVEDDGCWSVLFVVSGHECELPLPHTVATDVAELKLALAELASEALGPKATPASWLDGDVRTMRVQYVDADERPLNVRSSSRLRELRQSPFLRVSKQTEG